MTVPVPPRYRARRLPSEPQRGRDTHAAFDTFTQEFCSAAASKSQAEACVRAKNWNYEHLRRRNPLDSR
jgi:hypothetical protein